MFLIYIWDFKSIKLGFFHRHHQEKYFAKVMTKKNKKIHFLLSIYIFSSLCLFSQENNQKSKGKAFATIYTNFHQGIIGSATEESAFELERGYIGYEYNFSDEFYAKINVDVGSPNDLSPYSKLRRYAYFKNAFLQYTQNKLQIEFGLISLKQFKLQEKIWERRYLMKTMADQYKLGSSADLGINFHYLLNEAIDCDLTIMNGEGYNNIQMDNIFKYGLGSTLRFPDNLTSRIFYDLTYKEIFEKTLLIFSSYNFRAKWNLAGEFILRSNQGWEKNHNIYGVSFFGKYNISGQYQVFARFDKIGSNILEENINPWNLINDGSALITGLQYKPIKNIKAALNYQDWYPLASNRNNSAFVYLNLEIKL